jgi:hypothetical protein
LTVPDQGTYAGISVFQERDNTRALSLSGQGLALLKSGAIYARGALLSLSGQAQLQDAVVVNRLQMSGSGGLTQMVMGSDGADTSGIANTLLAGDLLVYVNNTNGSFTADELARIQDTINGLDTLLAPYSVTITEVSDPAQANLVIDAGTTSACGGAANGVLGCFNPAASEITLIVGWNWYTGADPNQIGSNQYDFQTTVTHEFGHALGLGGATDPNSPMHEVLESGAAHRTMTVQDLNIPYPPDGADPLTAAAPAVPGGSATNAAFATAIPPGLNAGEFAMQVGRLDTGYRNGNSAAWQSPFAQNPVPSGAAQALQAQDALFSRRADRPPADDLMAVFNGLGRDAWSEELDAMALFGGDNRIAADANLSTGRSDHDAWKGSGPSSSESLRNLEQEQGDFASSEHEAQPLLGSRFDRDEMLPPAVNRSGGFFLPMMVALATVRTQDHRDRGEDRGKELLARARPVG